MSLTPPDYVSNPYQAWAWITLGKKEVTLGDDGRPQHLVSFQHQMSSNVAGHAIVELFDASWTVIEDLVIANAQEMTARYGYFGGRQSPTYKLVLQSYTPKFQPPGVKITFEAVSSVVLGVDDRLVSKTHAGKDIHEIVQGIASARGWKCDFDEALPVLDNAGLETANLGKATFVQSKMKDLQFIREVLAPRALRKKDKVGNYRTWFDDSSNTLHFHPPRAGTEDVVRKYIFMRDRMGEMISFAPEIKGAALAYGGGVSAAPYMDAQTGEVGHVEASDSSTPDKTLLGGPSTQTAAPKAEQAMVVENRPLRDADQADAAARNRYHQASDYLYGATAVVVGDPELPVQKIVDVTVLSPAGKQHYTSGPYLILELLHVITDGSYQTTLTLHRNAQQTADGADKGTGVVRSS
jgi:hypothetical protein